MSDNMTATTTSSTVTETDQNNQSEEGTPQLFSDELLQREILCETKEGDKVPVRISLLLQSKTFGTMWKDLNMSDGDQLNDFVFPIKAIPTQIFNKVILWLREHVGQPEPVIEEDPNTRERKWFTLNEWEQEFYPRPTSSTTTKHLTEQTSSSTSSSHSHKGHPTSAIEHFKQITLIAMTVT